MSAQNTLLTAITAAERGAFEYLPKPFDLKELVSVVQRALAQRDQIDAFLTRPEVATVVQQMQAAGKLQPAGGLQAEHG